MTELSRRIERLRERRTDPRTGRVVLTESSALEKLAKALPRSQEAARSYLDGCIREVGDKHTARSFASAARVESALSVLVNDVEFEYQGSVTTNTHIRVHSDIDLLVVTKRFVSLLPPLKTTAPYKGSPINDLFRLRKRCEDALELDLELDVSSSGSKAISVQGSLLDCKVDVVPSNWCDTHQYRFLKDKVFRGVEILDMKTMSRLTNFPFLHNTLINRRDKALNGMLKPTIRLMKSIRADSDYKMDISSFDIASICYRIPDVHWPAKPSAILYLLAFLRFATSLLKEFPLFQAVQIPTEQRPIFALQDAGRDAFVTLVSESYKVFALALGHRLKGYR